MTTAKIGTMMIATKFTMLIINVATSCASILFVFLSSVHYIADIAL